MRSISPIILMSLAVLPGTATPPPSSFRDQVQPFVAKYCYQCHNEQLASGGLNLKVYADTKSFLDGRDTWERVLGKLATGEMPPKGIPRPPADQVRRSTEWLKAEFARQDAAHPPDPGRVTMRRLNRYEYNHTIENLLNVDFRPADDFPADDFGYGFDNIGDVLTVSPALMEKYLMAARKIARLALEADAAPKKPVVDHHKRLARKTEMIWDRKFAWEGDYEIRAAVMGARKAGGVGVTHEFADVFVTLDGGEPRQFRISANYEQDDWRSTDIRMHVPYGTHRLKAWVVRDQEPTVEYAWKQKLKELAAERKAAAAGTGPAPAEVTLEEFRKTILAQPQPFLEFMEVRGPYDPLPPPLPEGYRRVFICGHQPGRHNSECVPMSLADFARRAWRRPVTDAEVRKLVGFVQMAQSRGAALDQAMRVGVEAVLVSPYFLFRVERDPAPGDPKTVRRVNDFELATRLSYFIWSSMPDEELFQRAAKAELSRPLVLTQQVRRMLQDRKAHCLVENFGGQWLQLRNLDVNQPDPDKFPEFTEELRRSMKQETELFFSNIIREDRSILEFLTARYSFVNEALAKLYDIPGVTGDEFRKVDLAGTNRTGVLTQASVLTVSSYATRTSPPIRGKWILENLLNAPPPPPPADVPPLSETGVGTAVSLRQQFEAHRSNPICAGCHARMDPLGFGLENFDAIGRWRTQDGKFPIDASGTLPDGRSFSGPTELMQVLQSDKEAFTRCLTEKMLTFALGRGLEKYDRPAVEAIGRNVAASGYRFSSLMLAIVRSAPFQMRRGETAKPAQVTGRAGSQHPEGELK